MRPFSTLIVALLVASALPAAAQQPSADSAQGPNTAAASDQAGSSDAVRIEELRRRLEVLAAEVEQLRSGEAPQIELTDERRRSLGLAPSAAATYRRASEGVSFAGYGEMLLENFKSENESGTGGAPTTRLDFLRAILYAGYRFNDRFLFNSEIEIEHANEISVEFAYVDYLANDNFTLRAGMVLLPLGLVNEFHEPTVFIGAKRPETEQRILPTTWRENGAGVLGSAGMVNFRAYVTNGLRGAAFTSAGLRGGRQKGGNALAANLAFSGRVDVTPVPGIFGGAGFYRGGSGQEQVVVSGERLDLGTTVAEVHGQAQLRGFDLRALFARASVDDAGAASRALNLAVTAPIAETMQGGYAQLGYNVLSQFNTPVALTPYVRYEAIDTQHRVPADFVRDRSRDGVFKTLGIELKPIPNVVVKTDYQWISNGAGTGRNQVNVNLGYAF
jgi:hypothetical protein